MNTTNTISSTQNSIDFPVWNTIKLGTGLKTLEEFRTAFEDAGIYFGNMEPFLRHHSFTVASELTEVDLVKVSNEDLGHDYEVGGLQGLELRAEIIRLALAQGLLLCPAEVGPQLRLQYGGPDYVLIGTEPLPYVYDGKEGLAGMGISSSEDGKKLHTSCFMADWFLMNKVFVKPRKREQQ